MINIYLIDTFKVEKNHGLNTYIDQLGLGLNKHQLTLTYVWINSPFQKTEQDNIYIPKSMDKSPYYQDLTIAQLLSENVKEIDNPIFHFNWINHLPISHHLKRLTSCITILTKHCIPWRDLVTNHYPSFYEINQAFVKGHAMRIREPKMQREVVGYDSIDHIITVTECAKKSLVELFKIDTSKITKVTNGLASEQIKPNFRGDKKKLRSKYGFNEDEKLIIYAGNVNPRKGIFDVVSGLSKLYEKYTKLKLIIAGPGNYDGVLKLLKGNWGRVTICGSLDKQTLYDFYAMADIGIVPSYVEQCSFTCIEMMYSGLPLIVSDVDGLKEMVDDNCGLKTKVDFKKNRASLNQKLLLEKISFLIENPRKAKLLSDNAQRYAFEQFNAERMAKETIATYHSVILKKIENEKRKYESRLVQFKVPFVSIIIPCYNTEKHLIECLNSIKAQTFTNFEIILINDGSTDGTEKLIKNHSDLRIVYIKNDDNLGVAQSLNKGIALAKGKYILRMDADDTMHEERLQIQINFLENNNDYGLVGSWHNVTDPNGLPIQRIETHEDTDLISLAMLFYNPISHPTVMMRSELAKTNPYNVEYIRCEDYELWFRLAKQTKIKNIPKALVSYRIHENSTGIQHQKEMQHNVMELLSNELEKLGIDHTAQELLLHCTIGFGMAKRFFNTPERIEQLNSWLDKVFNSNCISTRYTKMKVKKFRKLLLETVVN